MKNITDALLGLRALRRQGYSEELIRQVLSSRAFRTEQEIYAALEEAKAKAQERPSGESDKALPSNNNA